MLNFTEIEYSNSFFNSILFNIFNSNEQITTFLKLINHNYISISGSSILQTIKQKKYDNSDLDIYIEVENMNLNNMANLINFLHQNFDVKVSEPYNSYICDRKIKKLKDTLNNYINDYHSYDTTNNETYPSLRKYLISLISFNSSNNKKIELIFISKNIETILLNTFDYDIVKNYWKQGKIYCNNHSAINENIATMTLTHFINRICLGSEIETENFINRYMKYYNRGYKFFIHKTFITKEIFIYIGNLFRNKNYIYYDDIDDGNIIKFNTIQNRNYYCLYLNISQLKTTNIILEKRSYIIKYLLLTGVYQNYKFRKNILKYSNNILQEYLHPDSPYIIYKLNEWQQIDNNIVDNIVDNKFNKKQICYISNNNLKELILK